MDLGNEFNDLVATVNIYDIFGTCWGAGIYPQAEEELSFPHLYNAGSEKKMHRKFATAADYTPWAK